MFTGNRKPIANFRLNELLYNGGLISKFQPVVFFFILILNITNNNITFYHTKFLITILHYRDDTMGSEKIMTTP